MGWYPDPAGGPGERYWDGTSWTRNLRDAPEPQPAMMPESLAALQPAAPRRVQDGRPTPAQQQVPSSRPDPRPSRWGSTEDGFELAGWWRRVAATIIDFVIIAVVVMASLNHEVTDAAHEYARFMQWANDQVAAGKTPTLNPQQIASQFHFIDPMTTLITAYVIAQAVYQFIMLSACAASVGQLVMRMRVIPNGQGRSHRRLPVLRALARALGWSLVEMFNQFLIVLTPISYLMPLFQRRRQTLHDLIAGTQVITVPRHDDPNH